MELVARTAPSPTAAGIILANGLGKYKSVACASPRAATQAACDTLTTSRAELLRLIARTVVSFP
jgi:hypothetical protein